MHLERAETRETRAKTAPRAQKRLRARYDTALCVLYSKRTANSLNCTAQPQRSAQAAAERAAPVAGARTADAAPVCQTDASGGETSRAPGRRARADRHQRHGLHATTQVSSKISKRSALEPATKRDGRAAPAATVVHSPGPRARTEPERLPGASGRRPEAAAPAGRAGSWPHWQGQGHVV